MESNNQIIESLFRSLQNRLRQFILKRVSDTAVADDILQDVFLKIHARIDMLKDETKLEAWVFQIARNTIVDHYRAKNPPAALDTAVEVADDAPEESAVTRLAPGIHIFIDELPEQYREALMLVEYEGLSQKELAEKLGISLSGAKSRVQRARAMLRDLLMQCCHFEFDRYGTIIDYHPRSCCCCAQQSA